MKLVIISDTHTKEKDLILPKGDILIYAGDAEIRNDIELMFFINWLQSLDFKHIIFIGGNHDLYLEKVFKEGLKIATPKKIHYLCNDSIEIEGIKFWGSPFSPQFGIGWAFNGHSADLKKIWDTIPSDTNIVITHAPPFGINDQVRGISQGCPFLRDKVKEIKPYLHCHAHIHEGYGIYQDEHTIYVNGSVLDEYYDLVNKPIVIDYE